MFALRHSAKRITMMPASRRFLSAPGAAAPPSVKDILVRLTVVDPSGARKQITGLVGK